MKGAGLLLAGALGLVVGASAAAPSPAPKVTRLEAADATRVVVPWAQTAGLDALHGWLKHECCDCGLTHTVLFVVTAEGIEALWWVDVKSTRRARAARGLPQSCPIPDLRLDERVTQ